MIEYRCDACGEILKGDVRAYKVERIMIPEVVQNKIIHRTLPDAEKVFSIICFKCLNIKWNHNKGDIDEEDEK